MHPVRRRKKRPNYGVRTVEVSRGKNGFGFTISGQQPCILSCIVAGSPAESAGLRAGDYLVAVEGQSVSKVPHNDVVRLIASSSGILKLQIAENYYSDSSDDDAIVTARQKPKYPHKLRSNIQHSRSNGVTQQSRAAKVVRDLRSGVMFEEQVILEPALHVTAIRNTKPISETPQWKAPNHLPPPLPRLYFPGPSRANSVPPDVEEQLLQAVVGYLGTIEMPRKIPPGSRLQIVRGCIKRLRADKRTHTVVLMTVLRQSLRLTNSAGQVLAIYPADRVTFCGSSSDEDRKHFGIVTTSTGEDPSNSCHVFTIDSRTPHPEHLQKALLFKIECNIDPVIGLCREFPQNSDAIIAAVRNFYESGNGANRVNDIDEPVMANSPQPSNDSTTTTSNSDSGIGFRDDCGNQSDRILVVDVQNQCLHIQKIRAGEERQETISDCERLAVRAMPVTCDPQHLPSSSATAAIATSNRSRSPLSTSSEGGREPREDMSVSSSGAAKSPSAGTGRHSADDMSIDSARSQDAVYNKLSPKVFGVPPPPTSQSLEDLKVSEKTADSVSSNHLSRNQQHWGSLQELRSFVSDCFETSPAAQELHEDTDDGVSCWATSFEKLLEDSNGLHAFSEFLKKEFSHENIYFWVACERYRNVDDLEERQLLAQDIFDKHLCLGALEPVNVDSHARQVTQEELGSADPSLFLQAQKQIFNLMKFDSYPRFIKSDLYNECLLREMSGEKLPFEGKMDSALELNSNGNNHTSNNGSSNNGGSSSNSSNQSPHQLPHSHSKLKKSRSDAEERLRRKSLLPWSRKSRCKSRDRVADDAESSVSSSRSSLASWDLRLSGSLCRVILPDGATAVVQIRPPQTIRQLVQRLLEKRALLYSHFQVFLSHSNKALELDEDALVYLGGREVRVEDRVVFRLDLPNRKTVAVKSKHNKTLAQVLRPILHKYGYRLEMVTLCLMSENEVVEPSVSVVAVDNQRIQVLTRSTPTECIAHIQGWHVGDCSATHSKVKSAVTLDEITNRVFEDLLQGKTENLRPTASDQGSVRSDDWGSEHSSGIVSRLLRRDSAFLDKGRDCRHKNKKTTKQLGGSDDNRGVSNCSSAGGTERKPSKIQPLIAKWKPGTKIEGRSESDVLYEDLKRAQRSRLEDQRGTEINFELPDFLKDKENAPQGGKKIRKIRRDGSESIGNSKFYQQDSLQNSGDDKSTLALQNESTTSTGVMSRFLDQSFSKDSIIPTSEQAEEYFLAHSRMPPPKSTPTSNNNNTNNNNNDNMDTTSGTTLARPQRLPNDPPPPLPPKPKLPPPSSSMSWPLSNSEDPKLRNCRVRRAVYLDQPSSSFV